MSISEMLLKSNPVPKQRETSQSEYNKLVDTNTKLIDKIKDQEEEIERLNNRIHALEKHNLKLQLEAQKYFDLLMECEYGDKGEDKE